MTKFGEIYDIFFSKIKEYEYAEMLEEDLSDLLRKFLMSSISRFRNVCRKDLSHTVIDPETGEESFFETLDTSEKEILAQFMVVIHLDSNIVVQDNLNNYLNSRDFRQYSNANLLKSVKETRKLYNLEAESLMNNYDSFSYREEISRKGNNNNDK